MKRFQIKTEVCFGQNALDKLRELKHQRIMIITDRFMVESGMIEPIKERISNCFVSVFDGVTPDPSIEVVREGVRMMLSFQADVLIAFGGGSSMDAAKAMKRIVEDQGEHTSITLVAIPTTSGTGSEVTSFSVISDKNKGMKYALASEELIPDIAILDPDLVASVPASVTADTGMDVITHAMEAYVSTDASDCTDALSEKAITLSLAYLPKAYRDGADLYARERMHNASCIAGIAFQHASLGINHSIAHAIGGRFRIAHGRINAMLLPHVIAYNAGFLGSNKGSAAALEKYAQIARLLGISAPSSQIAVKNLIRRIKELLAELKIPRTLKEHGISPAEIQEVKSELAEIALADICTKTNPVTPTKADLEKIIESIIR